jgi:hypothetical protein
VERGVVLVVGGSVGAVAVAARVVRVGLTCRVEWIYEIAADLLGVFNVLDPEFRRACSVEQRVEVDADECPVDARVVVRTADGWDFDTDDGVDADVGFQVSRLLYRPVACAGCWLTARGSCRPRAAAALWCTDR